MLREARRGTPEGEAKAAGAGPSRPSRVDLGPRCCGGGHGLGLGLGRADRPRWGFAAALGALSPLPAGAVRAPAAWGGRGLPGRAAAPGHRPGQVAVVGLEGVAS